MFLVVAGVRDSSASALNWSDVALSIAVVAALAWFVVRKPWEAYRHLAPSAKSASHASSGVSGAPPAFAQLIPGREEAEDLFSSVLNVAKPRPIKWCWTEKAAMVIAFLTATLATWTAYEALRGKQDEEAVGIALLVLILYPAMRLRFPVIPDFPKLRLLRFAEVTVGRVVSLNKPTASSSSNLIFYAFVDGVGRAFIGQGIDYTDSLGTGAPVVVFYEALDPTRNVTIECSRFLVNVPTGQLMRA